MNDYDKIKRQITFTTGSTAIICPSCNGDHCTATVKGMKKEQGRYFRDVETHCRSCGTIYTFRWFRS
jgi:RNase P subunit RPR2